MSCITLFYYLIIPQPQTSTLLPYTTLFRSNAAEHGGAVVIAMRGKLRLASEIAVTSGAQVGLLIAHRDQDRKSTRLNSSHVEISYAVFCLNKKKLCLFLYVLL